MTEDSNSPRAVVERFLAANDALDVDGMFEEIAEDDPSYGTGRGARCGSRGFRRET